MFNVLEHFNDAIQFNCKNCDNYNEIIFNDFGRIDDFNSSGIKTNMGMEVHHIFSNVIECNKCETKHDLRIIVVEYPIGSYSFSEVKVN